MTPKKNLPAAPVTGYVCRCPEPHRQPDANAEEVDMYLRISLDKRKNGIEQVAVERQTWEICKMCGERNWRIVRVWTDNDKSATSGAYRPAFEGILLSAATRTVVTYHTDRFVRLTKELERVIDKGLLVHAVYAGSHDLSNPTGIATAKTVTTWAQHEGELKAIRQKSQNRQAALSGEPRWWTRTPFGYNADKTQNPEQAAALKQVYENLLLGASMGSQVRWLNEQGLISNTGAKWAHGSLRHVLMAARSAGIRTYTTVQHKGTPREERVTEEIGKGSWEPIVSEEIYRAVVHLLNDPSRFSGGPRGKVPKYLLTAFAKCGKCGSGVHATSREQGKYRYYTCTSRHRCINHVLDATDSIVIRKVIDLLQDPGFQAAWAQPKTIATEPALIEKAQLQEKLKALTEMMIDGEISRAQLQTGTEKVNKRIAEIDALLVQAGSSAPIADMLADLDYVWQEFDKWLADPTSSDSLARARQVVQAVCESITLLPRNRARSLNPDLIVIEPRWPEGTAPEA